MPRDDMQQIVEQAALQSYSAARRGKRISLANGRSVPDLPKYRGMVYPVAFNASHMLGNPAAMLKDPMPGAKYVWKNRKSPELAHLMRQGDYRAVETKEVDERHPYAMFQRIMLAGRPIVAWNSLILFEVRPEIADRRINVWEDYAISQLSSSAQQWETEVDKVSHHQMRGEFTVSDQSPMMNEHPG